MEQVMQQKHLANEFFERLYASTKYAAIFKTASVLTNKRKSKYTVN